MKVSNLSCLLGGAVLAALTFLPLVTAEGQPSPESSYTITLTAIAAVDEPHIVAAQIAAAAGGTIESVTEGTVTMRLAPSRARVVAADPRVQSLAPAKEAGSMRSVGAEAERMTWGTGVAYHAKSTESAPWIRQYRRHDGLGGYRRHDSVATSLRSASRLLEQQD